MTRAIAQRAFRCLQLLYLRKNVGNATGVERIIIVGGILAIRPCPDGVNDVPSVL
jgi:hypothetical protein